MAKACECARITALRLHLYVYVIIQAKTIITTIVIFCLTRIDSG